MKKNLIKILAILFLVILQFSFFNKLSVFTFIPNFIIIISLVLILKGFLTDSLLVAVLGGLFLDIASPLRFGFYALTLLLILLFLHFAVLKNLPVINPILIFLIIAIVFIFIDLIICLIIHTWPNWQIILNGLGNGLLGLIVNFFLDKFIRQEEIKFN